MMLDRHEERRSRRSFNSRPPNAPEKADTEPSVAYSPFHRVGYFSVLLFTSVVLINLFMITLTVLSLRHNLEQDHKVAAVTTRNMARILAEYTDGVISNMDGALLAVADEYSKNLASGKVDSQALNAYIVRRYAQVPLFDAIRVADAQGYIQYGIGVDPKMQVNIADREYFISQRNLPEAGLVISKPMLGRVSGKVVLVFSRRVSSSSGAFAGIVWGALDLEKYTSILSSLDAGEHGAISLRDQDMTILARAAKIQKIGFGPGSNFASTELLKLIGKGMRSATYDARSPVDDVQRTASFQKIGSRPLYIHVALASEDYLSSWRSQVYKAGGEVTAFVTFTLLLTMLYYKFWKRHLVAIQKLADQEAKFRIVADYAYEWEYWQGPDLELLFISPSCEQITGYSREDFTDNPELLFHIVHPDDRKAIAAHDSDISHENEGQAEFRIIRRDGEVRWIAHGCRGVFDADGKSLGRRASNRDITEMVRLNDKLNELARTDTLTCLANRRVFIEAAQNELKRVKRYGSNAAVLMIDVDRFKKINDVYGHGVGDAALVSLAKYLKKVARATDLPIRFGGEEFVFLLVNTSLSEAVIIAERVRIAAAQIVTPSPLGAFGFTVSIGVASFSKDDKDWSTVVHKADTAMYRAKDAGRNRVVAYDEENE